MMQHLGSIFVEGLDERRWTDLVAEHAALQPGEPRTGTNPLTGEENDFAPDPRNARVLRGRRLIGEMRLRESTVEVLGLSDHVATIAQEVATELGGEFQSWDRAAAEELLDGVDDIDWANLASPCASAELVPDHLRALLSRDGEERAQALAELHASLCHQGSIDEASAAALPFLTRMMARRDLPDRIEVVALVASIVGGQGFFHAHARTPAYSARYAESLKNEGKTLEAELEREQDVVGRVRREGAALVDLLLPLLRHPAAPARADIACVLGSYPERANEWIPLLETLRAEDTDAEVLHAVDRSLRILSGEDVEGEELRAQLAEELRLEAAQEAKRHSDYRKVKIMTAGWLLLGTIYGIAVESWQLVLICWVMGLVLLFLGRRARNSRQRA